MVPVIVRVVCEEEITDVPVTPDTTCFDVVECCRDPGDDLCNLVRIWQNEERILHNGEKPLEILQELGSRQDEVKFVLRYTVLSPARSETDESSPKRNGMKEQGLFTDSLPDGVELSLWELQEMAKRQQQQIESQQQILVAKEQRLRYLKHQEARTHQVAAENERLRRLRERVEAQELKLRKLRALRGQVDQDKITNGTLTSDLDSIRALFNEKEKELSLAVAKVEELTKQLEELKRNGRGKEAQPPASAALELDKLRRELLFRNKLKEQQNVQLNQQRDALVQRQEEINSIDKRITELQDRLQRKRLLNQQLTSQLQYQNINNSINNKNNYINTHNNCNNKNSTININKVMCLGGGGGGGGGRPVKSTPGFLLSEYQGERQNIAAVEPYLHVPKVYHQQCSADSSKQTNFEEVHDNEGYQKIILKGLLKEHFEKQIEKAKKEHKKSKEDAKNFNSTEDCGKSTINDDGKTIKEINGGEFISEFSANKSDPKYQTLPYNTKFGFTCKNSINQSGRESSGEQGEGAGGQQGPPPPPPPQHQSPQQQQQQQQPLMTAHSMPISTPSLIGSGKVMTHHLNPRVYGQSLPGRGQPVGGTSPSSSTSSLATSSSSSSGSNVPRFCYGSKANGQLYLKTGGQIVKPVSSVAPTSILQKSFAKSGLPSLDKPSPIYQTSSTKILPVQPQTLNSTPQGVFKDSKGETPSTASFPPGPQGACEGPEPKITKPALPPKPAVPAKPTPPPPPRQTHPAEAAEAKGPEETTERSPDAGWKVRSEVSSEEGSPRSPTPPPPPPPTTEPPDDVNSKRIENTEREKVLDNRIKTSQSSITLNSNQSGTRMVNAHYNIISDDNFLNSNDKSGTLNNRFVDQQPDATENNNNNNHGDNCSGNNKNINNVDNINNNNLAGANKRNETGPSTETLAPDLFQEALNEREDNKFVFGKFFCEKRAGKEKNEADELDRGITSKEENDNFLLNSKGSEEKNCEGSDLESSNKGVSDPPQVPGESVSHQIVRRTRKGNLKSASNKGGGSRRVSFDPLALLLDASLEGELELVKKTASQVSNPSAANDEGITALHNAICAGHLEIVRFLVEFGCDVNAQDSDGWTPLHCAASCNNLAMVRFLVENGACIFATTLSDHETAAEKCEEDEEGFDGCSEYLYSIQEKLGILNNGIVYAVYDYSAHNNDELSFSEGDRLVILRKGDELEREWWWSRLQDKEGYTPRNLLGLYPRTQGNNKGE